MTLPVSDQTARTIRHVAQAITGADALLITAGAGMSADSGLPVFRGNEGFWCAYPPLAAQRISFERMAQPQWFADRPRMAWAFYGHRLQLYREATPHAGYEILRRWAARRTAGAFVRPAERTTATTRPMATRSATTLNTSTVVWREALRRSIGMGGGGLRRPDWGRSAGLLSIAVRA